MSHHPHPHADNAFRFPHSHSTAFILRRLAVSQRRTPTRHHLTNEINVGVHSSPQPTGLCKQQLSPIQPVTQFQPFTQFRPFGGRCKTYPTDDKHQKHTYSWLAAQTIIKQSLPPEPFALFQPNGGQCPSYLAKNITVFH